MVKKTTPNKSNNKDAIQAVVKIFKKLKIDGGNIFWWKNWDLIFNLRKLYEGVNPS